MWLCFVIRWRCCWRITFDNESPAASLDKRFQFRLIHLVGAVTVVAATLGIARLLNQRYMALAILDVTNFGRFLDLLNSALELSPAIVLAVATIIVALRIRRPAFWVPLLTAFMMPIDAAFQACWQSWQLIPPFQHIGILYNDRFPEQAVANAALMVSLAFSLGGLWIAGFQLKTAPAQWEVAASATQPETIT